MKTTNYNETLRYDAVNVAISYYGADINVNATLSEAERTTSVNLAYDAATGERKTDVQDFSEPFTNEFYAAVDAKVAKVAGILSKEDAA